MRKRRTEKRGLGGWALDLERGNWQKLSEQNVCRCVRDSIIGGFMFLFFLIFFSIVWKYFLSKKVIILKQLLRLISQKKPNILFYWDKYLLLLTLYSFPLKSFRKGDTFRVHLYTPLIFTLLQMERQRGYLTWERSHRGAEPGSEMRVLPLRQRWSGYSRVASYVTTSPLSTVNKNRESLLVCECSWFLFIIFKTQMLYSIENESYCNIKFVICHSRPFHYLVPDYLSSLFQAYS